MKISKVAGIIAVPLLSTALLAGCGSFRVSLPNNQGTATCSVGTGGGKCSMNGQTIGVTPGAGHASGPATRKTPVPTRSTPSPSPVTVTVTPSPTTDAVTSVQDCMGQFPTDPKDTLVSFMDNSGNRQSMAVCLRIPPQTMALFLRLLYQYVLYAYEHGQLNTQQGVTNFTSSPDGNTLPSAVQQCRDQA